MKQKSWLYWVLKLIATPILKLIYRYEVHGKNSLPSSGRFILCSNHLSLIDPIFLMITQKRKICFMAKDELFKNKFLKFILPKFGVISVNREGADLRAVSEAEEILNNEKVLGIFLEGTRSKTGEFLKPKAGAALLSYRTNTPILPVCITGKDPKGIRLFKKVFISYGEPITVKELGIELGKGTEFREASRNIMNKLQELRNSHINT